MARKAMKLLALGFSRLVYTERVGGSNPSPPTSLRSSKLRLGARWRWLSKVAEERMTRQAAS